eukprot:9254748-Ditylum_brightwellii.AAC.1
MSEGEAVNDSTSSSDSEADNEVFWFSTVLPLLSIFQSVKLSFADMFGTFMGIDEIMIHFFGHFNHTHCMKHKPVKEGYKWFVLADGKTSYILNLMPDGWSAGQKGAWN